MAVLTGWNYKESGRLGSQNVAAGRINGRPALTGFFYETMYGRFSGPNKYGRNNEMAVLTKWP